MKIKFMQLPSRFHFFDPQLVDSGVVELKLIRDFFSVQRHMALVRSFIKPERQLHFANSPNWSRGNISHEDNVHTKEN